jgi:NTP pyrophosphatase (non-canonical NTP hydrolase)
MTRRYFVETKSCSRIGVDKASTVTQPADGDWHLVSVVYVANSFMYFWESEIGEGSYRDLAAKNYLDKQYTEDPVTLALGVNEEAGEVGKAVNWYHNPKYKHSEHTLMNPPDDVEHEIVDTLIYLAALANSLDLKIKF